MSTVIEVKEKTISDVIKDLKEIQEDVNAGLGEVYDFTSELSEQILYSNKKKREEYSEDAGKALKDVAGKAAVLRKRIAQDIALMILALEDAEQGRST